jgi:hypothetical protein
MKDQNELNENALLNEVESIMHESRDYCITSDPRDADNNIRQFSLGLEQEIILLEATRRDLAVTTALVSNGVPKEPEYASLTPTAGITDSHSVSPTDIESIEFSIDNLLSRLSNRDPPVEHSLGQLSPPFSSSMQGFPTIDELDGETRNLCLLYPALSVSLQYEYPLRASFNYGYTTTRTLVWKFQVFGAPVARIRVPVSRTRLFAVQRLQVFGGS